MTLDDLNETFDDLGFSGDTPIRYVLDGEFYNLGAVRTEHDGTVTLVLEED